MTYTLHLGDCLEVLKTIPSGSVDAVVTDPPYGIVNKFGVQDRGDGYGKRRLQFAWDSSEAVREAVRESLAKLTVKGSALVFCGFDTVSDVQAEFRAAGLTPKPFAWIKKHPVPPMPGNWWPSAFEIAVYGYKPGAWFGDTNPKRNNTIIADSLRNGNSERAGHPTQKPLAVMRHIVNAMIPPGGMALDPFMGSGTTGVACMQTGRNFIGIEIDPNYHAIAERRIAEAANAMPLLAAACDIPSVPDQGRYNSAVAYGSAFNPAVLRELKS